MKKYLIILLGLFPFAHAASTSHSSFTDQTVTISGEACGIAFWMSWWADDYPQNSAPGRLDLIDGSGAVVGSVVASHYRDSGVSVFPSSGSVDGIASHVGRFSPNGTPADGYVGGTWHLSGLAPGTYSVRTWSYETFDTMLWATGVFTDTYLVGIEEPPPPPPPEPPSPPLPEPEPPAPPPPTVYSLATSADAGGSVTPGGTYPVGSLVTVTATADASHYFGGWAGDAAGTAPVATVTIIRDLSVYATFLPKGAQAITFAPLPNLPLGAPPQTLTASSSSGLPVTFSVSAGPATLSGNVLTVTGPGAVTITATQDGDGTFLPAAPVTRTFTTMAPGVVRYQTPTRTLLGNASPNTHYVLPSLP